MTKGWRHEGRTQVWRMSSEVSISPACLIIWYTVHKNRLTKYMKMIEGLLLYRAWIKAQVSRRMDFVWMSVYLTHISMHHCGGKKRAPDSRAGLWKVLHHRVDTGSWTLIFCKSNCWRLNFQPNPIVMKEDHLCGFISLPLGHWRYFLLKWEEFKLYWPSEIQ